MNSKLIKQCLAMSVVAGTIMVSGQNAEVLAAEKSTILHTEVKSVLNETRIQREYPNTVFIDVEGHLLVREDANAGSDWVGKLYDGAAVKVIGSKGTWLQIESGSVIGYVDEKEFVKGEEVSLKEAMVNADVLNVRQGQGTDTSVIAQVLQGNELTVIGESTNGWLPIQTAEVSGYVYETYVNVETTFEYAESKAEETARLVEEARIIEEARIAEETRIAEEARQASAPVSLGGQAVVDYATQFIGNPYVWGGTDLMNGADCSGFVQSVYANFGISIPRTTWDIEMVGMSVDYASAIPGDLICYDGHIGIYMGNNQIINAIDEAHGINISTATFGPIRTVRRLL